MKNMTPKLVYVMNVDGVCCQYCKHFEQDTCPVERASPWSRWANWCNAYAPNPAMPEAKVPPFGLVAERCEVAAGDALLPCPFCGGRAQMFHGGFGECFVACADDGCGGRLGCGVWFATEAQAVESWNRRKQQGEQEANPHEQRP